MIYIYLLIELISILCVLLSTFLAFSRLSLDIMRILPIFCNLLYGLFLKVDGVVLLALLFSFIADFFFLMLLNPVLGVVFYVGVQFLYKAYLESKVSKRDVILWFLLFALACIFKKLSLFLCVPLYAISFFENMKRAKKLYKKNKRLKTFILALMFLAVCDLSIVFKMLFKKSDFVHLFFDCLEWTAYILSQMFLVLFARKSKGYST